MSLGSIKKKAKRLGHFTEEYIQITIKFLNELNFIRETQIKIAFLGVGQLAAAELGAGVGGENPRHLQKEGAGRAGGSNWATGPPPRQRGGASRAPRRSRILNAELAVPADPSTPTCSEPGDQGTGYRDPVAYSYLDLVGSSHVSGRAFPWRNALPGLSKAEGLQPHLCLPLRFRMVAVEEAQLETQYPLRMLVAFSACTSSPRSSARASCPTWESASNTHHRHCTLSRRNSARTLRRVGLGLLHRSLRPALLAELLLLCRIEFCLWARATS